MISGIYAIENVYNNKLYVGSSINIEKRWNRHRKDLVKNRHHNIFMQRSYLKYGDDCFVYFVLEYADIVSRDTLNKQEQYWIDLIKPEYNIGGVAGGDTFTKNPRKEEIRKIHAENLRSMDRSNNPPRFGELNSNWKGGVSITRLRCECGNSKGYGAEKCMKCTDKSGENNSFYGKHHTEETKRILSEKLKGKICPTRKRVLYKEIIYESAKIAAEVLGVKMVTLAHRCRNLLYGFCYVDENVDITGCTEYSKLSEEERNQIPKCDYRARMK